MKKTALTLILVSTFGHAEQFVVRYDYYSPTDERTLFNYVFSVQPLKKNARVLTVLVDKTYSGLYDEAIVQNQIDFATFVKEAKSYTYIVTDKDISGWKYIYRVKPTKKPDSIFTEELYLGLQTDRFKEGDKISNKGTLLPSIQYSLKDTSRCPEKSGIATAKWGVYKLSATSFCYEH